ncbi:hypothetical protein B0A49_08634 [Cryomyces minteri]|uniref:Inositol polyphosphate-related phosphatase domain-containing protein n=1 Tax=Cryomyces minteri TaxID=331657 RepID=A0A4U0WQX7_9PEZI|nr:hypothetical protein B0A49_08634 [Cryomyces minteri]
MVAGLTFPYYSEARITFLPTYKYNNGTDVYDTSDKARIPAWCDRILRKGDNLRQINYNTAPLRFSDHRPVYATFQCTISVVDEKLKEQLSNEIYNQRRAYVGDATANGNAVDSDDEDLIGYESIEPGLPPASSDRRVPARSTVQPPAAKMIPNPNRPSNPFTQSSEPDWSVTSSASEANNVPFPPPPRRAGVLQQQQARQSPTSSSTRMSSPQPPPPPPRTLKKPPPPSAVDDGPALLPRRRETLDGVQTGLLDESDDEEMRGWQPLKPQ